MGKIRILEAIRQGKIGGGETHVLELVAGIDKSVFEPIVLSFTEGPMVNKLQQLGIAVYVIETEKGFDFTVWKQVKKLIGDQNIDIVHAHGTRAMSNVFWAARKLKLPLIYTIHGWSFHPDQKPFVKFVRELSERFLTRMATSNICVSLSNQKNGVDRFNLKRSIVIYNGINTEKFNQSNKYKDIRAEFNIPDKKTLIGFIVRITKQKDPLTLIHAMDLVVKKTNDIYLLIVGDGDLKEEAVLRTEELGLSQSIIFENFRQDIPDILSALDIYCLPSLWEGLPIGILEAMAMGKVVIATPVDGTPEIIENNQNGILIPTQDPEELADAILNIHLNPLLKKDLENNAIKTIHEKFKVKTMVAKIEDHYRMFLNK